MSVDILMETMKAENDFCSICLRTKAEVKLDPISNKLYQMFFLGLVKCVESMKASSICMWCRRRVVNALKLVETAQTTNRILANISLLDKIQSESFKQIVWDQIQAIKAKHGLIPRTSRLISYSLPFDKEIIFPMKLECEDGISGEEGNVCFDNVVNENQSHQIQNTKETPVPTSRTARDVSFNLLPDTRIHSLVKLEHGEDDISVEDVLLDSVINEGELDHRDDSLGLGGYNSLELKVESNIDDDLTSEFDIKEETPCLHEVRKGNNPESNAVMKKTTKEMESNKTVCIELLKMEPVDADGNQNSVPEVINENTSSEFGEGVSMDGSQLGKSHIQVEVSGTPADTQTTYSSADAQKYIRKLKLTEGQLLQELERKRKEKRYIRASFKCETCALTFAFRDLYEAHMERHLESFGSHKCPTCGLHFKKVEMFRRHCRQHKNRFACTVCGCSYAHRPTALQHYLSEHVNERYGCEHCATEFRTVHILRIHMKKVHGVERSLYSCPHCSHVFTSKSACYRHMRRHNDSVLRTHDSLESHSLLVTHSLLRQHRCKLCSATFHTANILRRHKVVQHLKEFVCQICGDRLRTSQSLKGHLKKKHSDICCSFECDYCQKTFRVKRHLKEHISWVHLRRGYKCQLCSKVLRLKCLLERHVKEKHGSWKPPKDKVCNVCGKGFARNSNLKSHQRVHAAQRRLYRCLVCFSTFENRSTLGRHKQEVHRINN